MRMLVEFHWVVRPDGVVAVKDFDLTLQQFLPGDPVTLWTLLKLGDTDSADHIMRRPDFYYREGFAVLVARVPNA